MTRRQLAVPVVAALVGSAVTVAGMTATGTDNGARQRGLLASAAGDRSLSVNEIYERAAPAVVAIRARSVQAVESPFETARASGPAESISTGSGFVLDDEGHIVTNAHVVTGVTDVQITFSDLRTVPARVVGKDEETDLAVLWVDPDEIALHPLELGDSESVQAGDKAVAIGNPSGLGATAGTGTVATPHSQVETPDGAVLRDVIETDAVIEPATSGGPLIGADGRVIGISSALAEREAGVGYAVPANTAKDVLAQLQESHKLIRPYLGLRGRTVPSGVLVVSVYAGGPADQAALQGAESGGGDVIEAIDGRPVASLSELLTEVDRRRPGETVQLTIRRAGSRGDVNVTLAERPATLPAG